MLVAYQGSRRQALVDPSMGSITATGPSPGSRPLSSLNTPQPAGVQHPRASPVGHQIAGVLAGAVRRSPVVTARQSVDHRVGRLVQNGEERVAETGTDAAVLKGHPESEPHRAVSGANRGTMSG